jgi:hypothetical protein
VTVRRRLLPRLVVLALAAAAAALAGWAWHRRVDLFQVPALWRTVRRLETDRSAFLAVENRGLSRFDVALSRLIRLQRPGFLGGKEFRLIPLRGRDVGKVVVAVYDPLDEDFEVPVGKDEVPEVVVYFCNCDFLTALALDASGRVLGEPLGIEVWGSSPERYNVVSRPSEVHDVLRIATRVDCHACRDTSSWFPAPARLEVSVDSDGLAVHGLVASDDLAAPLCPRRMDRPGAPGPDAAAALVSARTPGDIHRALNLIERGDASLAFLAEALLSDPDPLVRARAAILTARDPVLAGAAFGLLGDPEPRVRHAAILAARRAPGWEEQLLPLLSDPHPLVARCALFELAHSHDPRIAGPSLLDLLRRKERRAAHLIPYCRLAVPEFAEAIVTALGDDETYGSLRWNLAAGLGTAFDADGLRPHVARLIELHDAEVRAGEGFNAFTGCLAMADDPRADAALLAVIEAARPDDGVLRGHVLDAIIERWTPIRAPRAGEVLQGLLEMDAPGWDAFHCRLEAALVLLASRDPRGLEWLLANVEPDAEGEPALAAAARIIGDRVRESRLDCDGRTAVRALAAADGVHDAWR